MPIKDCNIDGKTGYKWGDSGKCYVYDPKDPNSRQTAMNSAIEQGRAAYSAGYIAKVDASDSFEAPQAVKDAAAKGLRLRRRFGRGGLSPQQAAEEGIGSGVIRASTLINSKVSYDTIKRMLNYFSRHSVDREAKGSEATGFWGKDDNPSAGYIAWLLWGGDPGRKWAEGIKERVEASQETEKARRRYKPGSPADQRDQSQPAKPSERITGSPVNPSGSATAENAGDIKLGAKTEQALRNKVKEHNEEHGEDPAKRVTYAKLAAVYRRGSGAFSTSHRPNMTRAQWSYARVNAFLYLLAKGKPRDPKYITDNDLLPKEHKRSTKKEVEKMIDTAALAEIAKIIEELKGAVRAHTSQYERLQGILDAHGYETETDKVSKEEHREQIKITFPITKAEDEQRLVTGIVLEPDTVDAHGDFETKETIQAASHRFLSKYNKMSKLGLLHKVFGNIGVDLVESYIAPMDMRLGNDNIKKGSWIMTVKVHNDGVWAKIKSGEITGFSIGGFAKVVPK